MAADIIRSPWKSTMSGRERFRRQMHFMPVDRSFNREMGYWEECYSQWDMFRERGIVNRDQADRALGFDPFVLLGGENFLFPAFENKVIDETDTHYIMQDGFGLLAEVPKDSHSSIPHYIKATVRTPDDWDRVKKERFDVQHPGRLLDIPRLKALYPDDRDFLLGVNCGSMIGYIRNMLTFEGICYVLYDYPEMLEDMVETCCTLVEHSLDQLLPALSFDYAGGWEDICFNHGPILPPWFFRDVIVPRYKRISSKLRQYGIDVWYTDCDGDIRPLIPLFLEGGMNCLYPLEVNSSGHPGALLDEYGRDLLIMGGVDKLELAKGPDAIDRYLESIAPFVQRGGFIPFCDHNCPPNVSQENYLYYLDRKEALFGMK